MKKKNKNDWFRLKRYPHIGLQIVPKDRSWIEPYVKSKKAVASHSFYPFIHRKIKVRKFRKEICHDGTRSKLRMPSSKERDVYFSNHLDSNIFSYYADILSKSYEVSIKNLGVENSITAYRRIKLESDTSDKTRNKCNIDFANDVFQYIKSEKTNLVAITFDIKSFFDNLDHELLKRQWKNVLESGSDLPPDHFNVFRNITKFSYVEENDLFNLYKDRIIVERNPNILKPIKIDKKKYFRNKRAVAYCTNKNIEEIRKAGLIKSNKFELVGDKLKLRQKGIPQGSPISAVLANIYMLDFDKKAYDFLDKCGGIYQRYSDDMVAICPAIYELDVIKFFLSEIKNYKLEIQKKKTQIFHFLYDTNKNRHFCFEKNLNTNKLQNNTVFEYLGFQFDGYYTLIKNASLSNYYRKMHRSFARSQYYTFHNRTKTKGEVYKNRLYKRFTYLGASRRRIYQRHPHKSDKFTLSYKYDWGNFITYANLASNTISDNKIDQQLKRHWRIFHKLLNQVEKNEMNKDK